MADLYVIVDHGENGDEPSVLPTGVHTLAEAQQMMQFRAEEALDEIVTDDAESDRSDEVYTIQMSDDQQSIRIIGDDHGFPIGKITYLRLSINVVTY